VPPDAESRTLGLVDAEAVRTLRPAALIADRFLPDTLRAAATQISATIVEPIFAASSLLALAGHTPPVDPLALAPLYARQPEAVTQWQRLHRPPQK
jgi:hypothetical protein